MTYGAEAAVHFERVFDAAAGAFCDQNDYPPVTDEWRTRAFTRLPLGLRSLLGDALREATIEVPAGEAGFRLPALPGKGPYAMFSRSATQVPAPNWEYFVQLAEYARLVAVSAARGWTIGFEDGLMDVSVYWHRELLWCIEVKEQAKPLAAFITDITRHSGSIDWSKNDRGDDPLRKAKYISTKRPTWFSVLAIGERHDFSVRYDGERFELHRDVLPL